MKRLIISGLALLWLFPAFAQNASPQAFTLKQAVAYTLQNNVSIANADLSITDADQLIKETMSIGMPKLNAGINYQRFIDIPTSLVPAEFFGGNPGEFAEVQFGTNHTLNASLDFNVLAFDGTFLVGLQASRLFKEYTGIQKLQVEQELKTNVTKAYLGTLVVKENQAILEKNITNLEKTLNETKALYKEGFVEQLDVDRLELSLQNLKTELDNLARQEDIVKNALKFAMGYPVTEELVIEDNIEGLLASGFTATLDEKLDLNNRAEIKVVDKGLELNDMDVKQYKAGYLPSVVVFASYQQSLQTNELFKSPYNWFPTTVAGLQINVPIFDGFEKRSKIQRAEISKRKAQNQRKELVQALNLNVENAKIAYRNAAEQLESQKRNLALAERIYKTTQIKYSEGVGSSIEVTQAEQSLYQTQGNYINALYNLLVAKADLELALGK